MTPAITDAEWEVMDVLWSAAGPLAAADVVAALAGRRRRSPRTVKALLNRLLVKRAVAATADGNRYHYRPAVARDRCVRAAARSLLGRALAASAAGPILAHLVAHAELSDDEVAHLQQLLADRRSARPRPPKKKGR